MADDCLFCTVDSSRVIFQNDHVFAIWDQNPRTDGHMLIITHRHVVDWFQATVEEQQAVLIALERGRQIILKKYVVDGFNVEINVGPIAGQTIPHLHVHLIPRSEGDVSDSRVGICHVIPDKGNYLRSIPDPIPLHDGFVPDRPLVRGDEDSLLPHLLTNFDESVRVDLAVAFVMRSGVRLIKEHIRDLLDRGGTVRLLTGDYLDVTDPEALVELLDLRGDIELRVFETGKKSFHPKAYLFYKHDQQGTAFVGSSNLSFPALKDGVEWNYQILQENADDGYRDVEAAFEELFCHPQTRSVDLMWINSYRDRRIKQSTMRITEVLGEVAEPPPKPHAIQVEAINALKCTRAEGNEAGLIVLATGLGKTWLAAFDSTNDSFRRVLFVAHREEILNQAMQTYRRIRPQATLGLYTGKEKSPDSDVLFASIQTLGRMQHLRKFPRDHFDYIVVDEFHHAAAQTYRKLIDYFTPSFLLGLTATPERMDGGDLLALCQENLVFRKDMIAGIEAGLLCSFQYFGVPDEVDYANIPWRSARFDAEELTNAVATRKRANNALEQFRKHGGKRALGFCCSQRHADFMADFFVEHEVRAVAVHSGERSAPRASALDALAEGRIEIIFAVDMFNEGLDIPSIDTVLMLRPTQSSTIWMQQFGRGLRNAEGKSVLKVIDYIGNHRIFLVKIRALLQPLLGFGESDAEISAAMSLIEQRRAELPQGCELTYDLEAIDIVKSLLRIRSADDATLAFYDDFRERHGVRPTALELYHSGYNPRSLKKSHGSWSEFLRTMNDLSEGEQQSVNVAKDFLAHLEIIPMTKSFEMLTLLAMLNRDSMPGEIAIDELMAEFRTLAHRNHQLRVDVGDSLEDDQKLTRLIKQNPIAAWCDGKGTRETAYFSYNDEQFHSTLNIPSTCREDFQTLVREIVDWRMAEYLEHGNSTEFNPRFVCRVIQKNGRLILKLPDRTKTPSIPSGWINILVGDQTYAANFVKLFINFITQSKDNQKNQLAQIMQEWFGKDAGQPGTRFEVAFESEGDALRMKPVGLHGTESQAVTWKHYMREDIPPLFGLEFSTGRWNQGFVVAEGHTFLLVTLEKGSLNKDHHYEDRFLSPEEFVWQSQNRTKQSSKHGQMIYNHREQGVKIHLFVRRRKKLLDGKASPFVYCGLVNFGRWEGEQPVNVWWRLLENVPKNMLHELSVPHDH